jgi:hypothetical protein
MTWQRFEIEARLEDGMTERRLEVNALQLVTACFSDDGAAGVSDFNGEPVTRPSVVSYLRPGEARALASAWWSWPSDGRRRGISQREPFCNHPVAARRVLSPFAGLRRVGPTCCTPRNPAASRSRHRGAEGFVGVVCVGATLAWLSLAPVVAHRVGGWEVMIDE